MVTKQLKKTTAQSPVCCPLKLVLGLPSVETLGPEKVFQEMSDNSISAGLPLTSSGSLTFSFYREYVFSLSAPTSASKTRSFTNMAQVSVTFSKSEKHAWRHKSLWDSHLEVS